MIIVGLGFGGNLVERLRISRLNYGLTRFTFDGQLALAQVALLPPITGWRMRSWVQDPLSACVTYK